MRVCTAFSRLLRLPGVWVRAVRFDPGRVVVTVALRRRWLICPVCGFETISRERLQDHDSVWRALDLGVWRLEIHARLRQLRCPAHGVRVEAVPFARPGSRFTRDFEDLVCWLAAHTDSTAVSQLLRIDWQTVGRIVERACGELLDPGRLNDLFLISIDEVAWRKGHRYLTLIADHKTGKIVWGCEGKGKAAADRFFQELGRLDAADATKRSAGRAAPAIMVPFGPSTTVPAGHGITAGWLAEGSDLDPALAPRASRIEAVSMDMTGSYAASVREHAPQAEIVIDNYHVVQLAGQALEEVRRAHWRELRQTGEAGEALRFKHDRWALLKNPEDLNDRQAEVLAQINAGGGRLARAWAMKEMVREIFKRGLTVDQVSGLLDRLLARLCRCRIPAFVRLGRTIRKHRAGILAARAHHLSNARAEALNNKAKLLTHRSYGFHSADAALALIYLTCGPITLTLPSEHAFA